MFLAQLSNRSKVAIGTDNPKPFGVDFRCPNQNLFVNKVDNKNKTTVLE